MAYLYIIVEKLKSHQYLMTLDLLKSIGYSFEKRYLTFMLFYVLQLCSFHSFFFRDNYNMLLILQFELFLP